MTSEADYEALKARWQQAYGTPNAAHHVDVLPPLAAPEAPWTTPHALHWFSQIEGRPGLSVDSQGRPWMEYRHTGLRLAVCNCGYTTGWILKDQMPSHVELIARHGQPTTTDITQLP